ncbi:hypothetical protein [Lacinutrix sp. MedPE-SW]|uniref:hypothetical protein n=1 Tax=Lacinutrix sp. MedPE-SW TaxID=1860087 RepID=UPI0009204739|nr:hypothetical protein [Lacinutrix sp. MedPE-SW]OIQ24020.1 MAG: hypothetical protein BM549_01545 [Lacinutrix sp. MedPE-SW]
MKNFITLLLGLIIGALIMYFICNKNTDEGAVEVTKPTGVITPSEARVLDKAYNSRHALISKDIVNKADNRSAWWSLEDIQNYIVYAQNQSSDLGFDMNGIRVYLGAYPTQGEDVGYTTMFLVPTASGIGDKGGSQLGGNNDIPDADPLNMGQGGTPPGANYPQ